MLRAQHPVLVRSFQRGPRMRPVSTPVAARPAPAASQPTASMVSAASKSQKPVTEKKPYALRITFRKPNLTEVVKFFKVFNVPNIPADSSVYKYLWFLNDLRIRLTFIAMVLLVLFAEGITLLQPHMTQRAYALGAADTLIGESNPSMAKYVKHDTKQQLFTFNAGYQPVASPDSITSGGPKMTATIHEAASAGVTVTDPVHKTDFTMTPKFSLKDGRQDGNRIIYPFINGTGWVVYTMHGIGVKEDVVLATAPKNTMTLPYSLDVGDGLEARMMKDGSIGVYGNTLLTSQVTTSTDSDAALLQKARQNAKKDTLMFTVPAPVIKEKGKKHSNVKGVFVLHGKDLEVKVSGLSHARYPLTIDPSIYVETAEKFMRGNNETNIDFDVADTLIQKGTTTGARFDYWSSIANVPTPSWRGGSVAAGGYMYYIGGTALNGQQFSSPGTSNYTVPTGVTTITVKAYGAGGGGGAGNTGSGVGGNGGGGGFMQSDITVTPGEVLSVTVGSGGTKANSNSNGGDGGGFSAVQRSSTYLIQAGGGGGGGGNIGSGAGGAGGAGGTQAANGAAGSAGTGSTGGNAGGGGGGTAAAGGTAGTTGTGGTAGATGAANLGGDAGGSGATCSTAVTGIRGNAGGFGGAGDGGDAATCIGGGGAGGGRFGGGGGGSATTTSATNRGAGGGGGASSLATGANIVQAAGSGNSPGFDPSDTIGAVRNGAGEGGFGGDSSDSNSTGASGLIVVSVTSAPSAPTNTVSWSQINTSDGTLDSADPGNGTCTGWCTNTAYNLPTPRIGFSLVAYSGFLYVIGGEDASCTVGNGTGVSGYCSSVYVAKLGANGEPQLWHPTDTNKTNWVYWYKDTNLNSVRSYTAAVAYNNRMYLLGGRSTSGTPVTTTEIASINPTGTLGTWTASTALPSARYGHSAQVYNDRLYLIGGSTTFGGAPVATVHYIKINSDGTLNSWVQTTSMSSGRISLGGNFSAMWGAYIYVSGGCSAINASGYCNGAILDDTQVASINADGSIDVWNSMANVYRPSTGHGLVAWRSHIYELGGCADQNTTSGECVGTWIDTSLGNINQDGDASTVGVSSPSGTAPCSGGTPYQCDIPATSSIGQMLNATAIINGYLYVIGGCTNNTCSTTSVNVIYASINSDGTLGKPATCPNSYSGAWCVDTTHTVTGGIAASGVAVFGGRIYLVGGLNGTANVTNYYYASVNAAGAGTLSAWSNATLSGAGISTAVSYTFAYTRANPSSVGTNPGNLYLFGGCSTSSAAGCTAYSQNVYKCNIQTAGTLAGCTTTGQLQIGIIPGDSATGLGIHAGAVYANYVYLIGGVSPNQTDLTTIRYAKFDNSNNVVAVTGSAWVESASHMEIGRRRGAAFGYNGYLYVVGGYDGTSGGGVLADIEFAKINVSTGDFGSFKVSAVAINQRWGLSVPVASSYAYVIGGCDIGASPGSCTHMQAQVQTFQIYNNDSGSPDAYVSGTNTGVTNIGGSAAILNGYIYYAGGCVTNLNCSTPTANVYYAAIDANGVVGSWSAGGALPAARGWGKLEAAGGTLYYLGGQTGTATTTAQTTVYYTTGISSGNPTWSGSAATNGLPVARTQFGASVWNNRIYVVGGYNTTAGTVTSTVYVSPQLTSGGNITSAWSTASTSFNVARAGAVVVAYANNLYVLGGFDNTNYLSDTQYSQLNTSTGDAGSWTYSTSLPTALAFADGFAANGYMYFIGGRSGATACRPISLVAPISANTTIASGNNPTGVGEWYETNARYTSDRYGAASVYSDGKVYVLGGACSAYVTTGNWQYYSTVLSQPQVAKYSIMVDADTDVFPSKWLLNGLDNSIGAAWQLKYRSMTNTTTSCTSPAMTTWGQETNVGNVTLGTPGTYTPKDGSGVNTNCNRFFYLSIGIDSSQTYGYPDDVSRGPTITDLTIEFTADPSKRLMHGRTFIQGVQQPDDTPF